MSDTSLYVSSRSSWMWKWRNASSVKVYSTSHRSVCIVKETQQTQTHPGHGPPACLSLIVIDSRFCNCDIALICLPLYRDKVPSSPTTDGGMVIITFFFFFCWGKASLFSSSIITTPVATPKVLQILNPPICYSIFRFQVLVHKNVCLYIWLLSKNRKMWPEVAVMVNALM